MYVYFITTFREKDRIHVKIGWSKDPEDRLRKLQIGSLTELRLLGKIRCRSEFHARQVEKAAHRIFQKQRRRGEWFHLSRDQMDQVKKVVKFMAAEESHAASQLR